jgi:hypothetical protein
LCKKRKGKEINITELKDGCLKPARGPLAPILESTIPVEGIAPSQEVNKMLARVGKEWEWIQRQRLE